MKSKPAYKIQSQHTKGVEYECVNNCLKIINDEETISDNSNLMIRNLHFLKLY